MSAVIVAWLRGPSIEVWPAERGYPPRWVPTYAETEQPLDSPIGRMIVAAAHDGSAILLSETRYHVEGFKITVAGR